MIKRDRPIISDEQWLAIFRMASGAREAAIEEFNKKGDVSIDDGLYKRYMPLLLSVFRDKCAYCESKITSNQPGDVEHFRPKGRIVGEDMRPIRVVINGKEINHPGYYWLAYEWENLLPACIDCNRRRYHGAEANRAAAGKADRFPILGKRACWPGEEVDETPLYIDPTRVDPDVHLEFLSNGMVRGRTEIGEQSIKDFGLDKREGLIEARADAFTKASDLILSYVSALAARSRERASDLAERIRTALRGEEPYTAMQRLAFETVRAELKAEGLDVKLPAL